MVAHPPILQRVALQEAGIFDVRLHECSGEVLGVIEVGGADLDLQIFAFDPTELPQARAPPPKESKVLTGLRDL